MNRPAFARAALPASVRNLRPIPPTIELMPGVTLYDHEADPDDVPVPDLVALALSVLLRSVDVPGSVSRPHTCEASAIVRGHFRVGADERSRSRLPTAGDGMSVQVSALPRPSTTTVRLHEPDVSYDGSPRHITVIAAEQLSVQFTTPREALAWLAHCSTLVRAAWDRQADDMAGVA